MILLCSTPILVSSLSVCPAQQPIPRYNFAPIERLLRDSLHRFENGCGLLLIQDGQVIYEQTFGKHSLDSSIPIASGSKWLAAALCLKLWDKGVLSPSDPVRKYLPYFTGEKAGIRISHLLAHTSGLPGEVAAMRDTSLSLKTAATIIGSKPLLYPTGTAFLYGGASMQVLGRIVEIAGGQRSWESLFQEYIAKPLGMRSTTFYGLGVTNNPLIGGGAASSARDYAKFLMMLVNRGVWQGKVILSENAIAAMHRDHTAGVPVVVATTSTTRANNTTVTTIMRKRPFEQANYGFGVWRVVVPQTKELVEVNAQGRWGFSPWIDFRRNIIGILSTRCSSIKPIMPTYRRLKQILRDIIPPKSTLPKSQTPTVAPQQAVIKKEN